MVVLEIWYNQRGANDYGPGDPPIVVETVEELDAFVDRVLVESVNGVVPPMIEASVAGDMTAPVLNVGLGQDKGFIYCMSRDGGWTKGNPALTGTVSYDYMRHVREIPASAEVPLEVVRRGLTEFLQSGERPKGVEWGEAGR